jgi:hypothetical protein
MSFITGLGGAAAADASGLAGAAGFSAAAGLASSSAMIRRIDARISSIEGSWTFAGCVISNSTSSTPLYAFYPEHDRIWQFRNVRAREFHRTSLTCPQIKRGSNTRAKINFRAPGTEASRRMGRR